jgi:hypothetical protein
MCLIKDALAWLISWRQYLDLRVEILNAFEDLLGGNEGEKERILK